MVVRGGGRISRTFTKQCKAYLYLQKSFYDRSTIFFIIIKQVGIPVKIHSGSFFRISEFELVHLRYFLEVSKGTEKVITLKKKSRELENSSKGQRACFTCKSLTFYQQFYIVHKHHKNCIKLLGKEFKDYLILYLIIDLQYYIIFRNRFTFLTYILYNTYCQSSFFFFSYQSSNTIIHYQLDSCYPYFHIPSPPIATNFSQSKNFH